MEDRNYVAIMKEKLVEIKRVYGNLELGPVARQY